MVTKKCYPHFTQMSLRVIFLKWILPARSFTAFSAYTGHNLPPLYVVADIESTDKIARYARIIGIAALKVKDGKVIDRFETLVNPKMKIPKAVRELTEITDKDVAEAPPSYKVIKQFTKFLEGVSYTGTNPLPSMVIGPGTVPTTIQQGIFQQKSREA